MATLSCQPRSRGFVLDPDQFGFLSDSSAHVDDMTRLHQNMEDDGYLFLRGFFDREDVLAARKVVTDRLMEAGILDKNYSAMEGRMAKVTVVNARSAFVPTAGGGEIGPIRSYNADDLTLTNQPLRDLLSKGRVIDFFSKYLGGPARRLNYIWFRAVGHGLGTQPHCDWVYMSRGTPKLFTTWVPLGETPLHVGGLMILENSHKQASRLKNYLSRDVSTPIARAARTRKSSSRARCFLNGTARFPKTRRRSARKWAGAG